MLAYDVFIHVCSRTSQCEWRGWRRPVGVTCPWKHQPCSCDSQVHLLLCVLSAGCCWRQSRYRPSTRYVHLCFSLLRPARHETPQTSPKSLQQQKTTYVLLLLLQSVKILWSSPGMCTVSSLMKHS